MTDPTSPSGELTKLNLQLEQLFLSHANLSHTIHDLANRTSILENQNHHHPSPSTKPVKFDLPTFNGSEALGWIFKVTQFFDYHQTPPDQRIQISSFYLEGSALSWYQWMFSNGLLTSWEAFLRALELRFAPSKFDDPIASLCKLTQTNSLLDYLSEFETLANRISDFPQSFYLSCFLSGLRPNLRREVTAQQPPDLPSAIALAKLHDDKYRSSQLTPNRFGRTHLPSPPSPPPSSPTPLKQLPPLLPTPPTRLPIKRLTEAEMQARRDKNLCFNCDERYTRGHRCKPQFLLLTTFDSEEQSEFTATDEDPVTDEVQQEAGLISLHAFSGHWTPRTFRVTGSIQGYAVQILVDSGATHNFIQSRVAQFLHLCSKPTLSPLRVMVGNGEFLPCSSFCPQVQLSIDQQQFSVDLYPLELSGTDVVLGAHWLSMVSPFVMDYNGPFMRFMWQGNMVELQGDSGPNPSPITAHQLRRLQTTNRPPLQSLIHKYASLFTAPTSLPPPRPTDHSITLQPNTAPISVRPYRYPHFQKQEIESQVKKMLDSGFIKPSTSPYSSPVLLVKKKDGTWRFCVDYRALNTVTVKDKFPIPTVDELIDELGHASWFSKLDLFSGFHQILMRPHDSEKTAWFYRRFVSGYSTIAHPLTDLLKKDCFLWTDKAQEAFDRLKSALIAAPVLAIPKFDLLFVIQTDASGAEQQQYLFKLLGFDFEIQYKPGKSNLAADALSRRETFLDNSADSLLVLSVTHSDFLQDLKSSLADNVEFKELRDNISAAPSDFPHFSLREGLITYKGKTWLPSSCSLIPLLLHEFHSTPMAGHTGVSRTLSKLSANFYWPSIRKDVQRFVEQCQPCQQTKIPTQKPSGLLQPIPPPSRCWEDLSLDFVVGLPPYKGFTTILVVVDRFSKGAHFGMLPKSFSAGLVAQLFVDVVCKHHGLPLSLISDRDPIFLSQFWQELFRLSGTKLRLSTAYHPQTDGQTEVANKVLQQYLRCFVHHKPSLWGKFLSWAEWSFNTSVNASTGFSPFEVLYGRKPPLMPPILPEDTSNAAVQSELATRAAILHKLESNLKKAQETMKKWADKSRRELHFAVGDWVYIRLRPRRQTSVTATHSVKLMKRFFGPFKISRKIGSVAYEVELPPSARIHNVFHVSLLRPHKGPLPSPPLSLPPVIEDNHPILEPAAILDWKWDNSSSPPAVLVLVHWQGLPLEEATWEPWTILQSQFHLEDKVFLEPGGDVRNTSPSAVEPTESTTTQALNAPEAHARRVRRPPQHLEDYVTTCPDPRTKKNSVRKD
uniref:Retrotransposable element Tf2 n=1 Tax=Cajanus cajan TaxID=3821 RepID=A0A151U912_CAJCA|nr:Retrotransposable element Tf2 [Cajanus cajan]